MSFSAVLLGVFALAAGVAPNPIRAAVSTKYHFVLKTETTVDLSVVGAPSQITNLSLDAWVVLTLSDSAGGRVIRAVVDSVKAESTLPQLTPAGLDSAKGRVVRGFLDAAGRVKGLTSDLASNLALASVQGVVNGLFPKVKADAKVGESWVDTSEVSAPGEGNNTTVKLVTSYTAGAPESVAGIPGTRVNAKSTSTVSGTMENPMSGAMEVEGAGSGGGTFVVGAEGRFLGGEVKSTQELRLKVAMAPAPIPVRTVQALSVTLIP
jgi:hypothetical protein